MRRGFRAEARPAMPNPPSSAPARRTETGSGTVAGGMAAGVGVGEAVGEAVAVGVGVGVGVNVAAGMGVGVGVGVAVGGGGGVAMGAVGEDGTVAPAPFSSTSRSGIPPIRHISSPGQPGRVRK